MKLQRSENHWDTTDLRILSLLQENCKRSLGAIGERVGLSAPSVVERIHKLEEAGIITGYTALLDGRLLGFDVTAFIGVSTAAGEAISVFEKEIMEFAGVLECHHVTGAHTLMLKIRTENTASLEGLIGRIRSLPGVNHTETMVVLSTLGERPHVPIETVNESTGTGLKRARRPARRSSSASL